MINLKKILLSLLSLVLIIAFCFIGRLLYIQANSREGICVLGYHGVVSDEEKEEKYSDNRYYLSESEFIKQMQYLYDHGYTTLSMDEVYNYYTGNDEDVEKRVCLTFDDGLKNFNTVVKPILEKYNFKGTCFVIGKHLDDDNELFLKSEDIINTELVEYYSHSYNLHRKASGFDRKIIQELTLEEIDEDFKMNTISCEYFAFPYGRSVEGIEDVLKDHGVKLAFSYNQFRHLTRNDDQYYLPRYMMVDLMPMFYFKYIV